jgi:hypothetical protein
VPDQPRPYWYADAKWVCGLLATFVLSLALLAGGLFRLTDAQAAPEFAAQVVTDLLSQPGQKIDTQKLKHQLAPLYTEGVRGVAQKFTPVQSGQAALQKQLAGLDLLTQKSHNSLGLLIGIVAIILTILFFGSVYFSAGLGRLVTPGLILIWAALPGALFFFTISQGKASSGPKLANIGPDTLHLISAAFLPNYVAATAIGLVLVIAALILKFIPKSKGPRAATPGA